MARTILITGTDTDVGKTILTAALTRHLLARGVKVMAMKPICSGGRGDARALRAALERAATLEEINPWHFRAALAPVLAARAEGRVVRMTEVTARVRAAAARCEVLLVEGAGGVLSPLGEGFDSRDLTMALRARVIVVAANRLGAVGLARLAVAALPPSAKRNVRVVLMQPARPDGTSRSNPELLGEFLGADAVVVFPHLRAGAMTGARPLPPSAMNALKELV